MSREYTMRCDLGSAWSAIGRFALVCGVVLLISGCGDRLVRSDTQAGNADGALAEKAVKLPFPEPPPRDQELDSDTLFSFLVGELGARRAELPLALNHYLHVARLTGSRYAARRAARIAAYLKDKAKLDKAVRLWVEVAPNAIDARQLAARVALQRGDRAGALKQLRAILEIAKAEGKDGYLQAAAAFAKTTQAKAGIPLLETLAKESGNDAKARYAVALLALAAKQFDVAGKYIEPVYQQDADNARAALLFSQVLVAKKQTKRAIEVLKRGLSASPANRPLRVALARLLVDEGRLREAYDQFEKLHKAHPDEEEILYTMAILSLQLKHWDDAERQLRQLRAKGFKTDEVTYYLGQVAESRKRYKEAAEWYKAVANGSFRQDARIRLARVLALSGDLDKALDVVHRFRETFPDRRIDSFMLEGELLHEGGRDDQAYALYNRVLKEYPGNLDLRYSRGLIAAELGHIDVLEQDMRAILARKPEYADALNALGYTLADKTDRYQEAYQLISRALKLRPDSAAVMDSMGWVLYRMGRYDEALEYLRKAHEKLPDGEITAHLAQVLWAAGERRKASGLVKAALKKDPDNRFLKAALRRFQ
ncbi:MAG TPA: tetratricopeptide repeat protein [Chromatiaceae bacterium]|nr:tetratricopeptide repeat protein [Chromatiaceae bacterium]